MPNTMLVDTPSSEDQTVANVLYELNAALESSDVVAVGELFEVGGFWRDLVSFTWNIHMRKTARKSLPCCACNCRTLNRAIGA